jgi:hypothetical protein
MKQWLRVGLLAAGVWMTAPITPAGAQITQSGNGYLFRMKYTRGQKMNYVMNSENSNPAMPGGGGAMTVPVTMTVLDVKGKVATIRLDIGPVTMGGKEVVKKQSSEVQMDDRGRLVGKSGAPMAALSQLGAGIPEKPIKIGDSFVVNQKGSAGSMGNMNTKTTYKFLGIKTLGNRKVAQMSITLSSGGSMNMKGSGTVLFDMTDGSLVSQKMDTQVTMAPPGQSGQSMTMSMKTNMERK